MARYIALALTLLASTAHADCHQFFSYRQAYVAPVVAYAVPIYYQAGRDLEAEALADKVARLVTQKLEARLTAPQAVRAKASAGAFSKCVRCHGPESSVVLDGSAKVDCWTLARWVQISGQGVNVPPEMKKLVDSLSPQEKGAVADEMLNLGAADRPKPVDVPPPEPGVLQ
jgi:cytochrome c553